MGLALPAALLRPRCALTAPFHPYRKSGGVFSVALSVKSALSESPRPLAGMPPYGDRTFLPRSPPFRAGLKNGGSDCPFGGPEFQCSCQNRIHANHDQRCVLRNVRLRGR